MTVLKYALRRQPPNEALVRIQNKFASWRDRDSPVSTLKANGDLELVLGSSMEVFSQARSLASLETQISNEYAKLSAAPFQANLNASTTLGRICYLAARSLRPRLVMETGVAYGVTSA